MIDGYALIAISPDGNHSTCQEHRFFDVRLESMDVCNLEDWLTPEGLNDCLVMVFFKYKSVRSSGGWWDSDDYEDCFIPENHVVIQDGYKEFWREQISIQLPSSDSDDILKLCDEDWINSQIEEWEDFYDEDFVVHPKRQKGKQYQGNDIDVDLLLELNE